MGHGALAKENVLISLGAAAIAMALTLALDPFQFTWGFSTDAEAYLAHAHQLLRDGAFNMGPHAIPTFTTHGFFPAGTPNFLTPPVYIAFLAAGLALWDSWQVALIQNAAVFAVTVYAGLRILALQDTSRFARLVFAGAMTLDPAYLLYNGGVQLDSLAALLMCAFVLMWLEALCAPVLWKFALAGFFGAMACLTRGNMLPPVALLGLLGLAGHLRVLSRARLKGVILASLVGLSLLGGWAWRSEQITGRWTPTGSGNAGMMLSLNFSISGPRASPLVKVLSEQDVAAYARMLASSGAPLLQREFDVDREWLHQVMRYIAAHKLWAAQVFAMSNLRLFLASEFSQPALIADRLGGGPAANAFANMYVFGSRGLLLLAFVTFPWLMWRGAVAREMSWIWCAALAFVLLTAFVAPGADRYRLPIEPLCVLFVAIWAAYVKLVVRWSSRQA